MPRSSIISRRESIVTTVPVRSPYDFGLYPKLFVHEEDAYLPFRYSPAQWTRLIPIHDDLIPTIVTCEYEPDPKLCLTFLADISGISLRILRGKVAASFCTSLDLQPLYDRVAVHSSLRCLIQELNGLRPHLSLDPFESLIKVIVRQVVRASTAQALIDNLVRKFGTFVRVDSDDYFSFPTPESLAAASKRDLLDCRIGYKWQVIREVSREVVSGNLDFEHLRKLSNEDAVSILTEYKWIGPWTSRVFLYDGLHRLEAYPEFDISIKRAVTELGLERAIKSLERGGTSSLQPVWGAMVSYLFGSLWTSNLRR